MVPPDELDKEIHDLLLNYVNNKLVAASPVIYDRLFALLDDCENEREKRVLKTAVQYCLSTDGRSLSYLEKTALNWLQKGVPLWALAKIEEAGCPVDKFVAKEVDWHGKTQGPLDLTEDRYNRYYRRS
jgi:hypothetical protein